MPSFRVQTPQQIYDAVVERGALAHLANFIPAKAGKIFVVTTRDVWDLHGERVAAGLQKHTYDVLFFPGGEPRKKMAEVEALAEQMVEAGADRSSVIVAFGGGICTDVAGFLAAVFMRGIPVIQVPTTLLAQVDAAVGGKTGVNLAAGKNLVGSFHQPLAVLIDPGVLFTLPDREYRAGLYEIVKCGVIRDADLFRVLDEDAGKVLRQDPSTVDRMIADAVRIKAEVVTADERESGLRRILNFGHTVGHALEAETKYEAFLHGEAVAFGMHAATALAQTAVSLSDADARRIHAAIRKYGPIPPLHGVKPANLLARLAADKKTVQGKVHFVLPVKIGEVTVLSGIREALIERAIEQAIEETMRKVAA